jgi:valyl-tRNA synthetase
VHVRTDGPEVREVLSAQADLIRGQAAVEEFQVGPEVAKPPQSAAEVLEGAQLFVPLSGFMDVALEARRIARDLGKKEKALTGLNAKLHNQEFLKKAPEEVVEREKERKETLTRQIRELQALAASLEEKA